MSDPTPIEATETPANPDAGDAGVAISDGAVKRLRELTAAGEFAGLMMRVSVSGGGSNFLVGQPSPGADRLGRWSHAHTCLNRNCLQCHPADVIEPET